MNRFLLPLWLFTFIAVMFQASVNANEDNKFEFVYMVTGGIAGGSHRKIIITTDEKKAEGLEPVSWSAEKSRNVLVLMDPKNIQPMINLIEQRSFTKLTHNHDNKVADAFEHIFMITMNNKDHYICTNTDEKKDETRLTVTGAESFIKELMAVVDAAEKKTYLPKKKQNSDSPTEKNESSPAGRGD